MNAQSKFKGVYAWGLYDVAWQTVPIIYYPL